MYKLIFLLLIIYIIYQIYCILEIDKVKNIPFVAVGSGDVSLAVSEDGEEWQGIEGLFDIGYDVFRSISGRWVAVGQDTEDANIWWSDDGFDWNPVEGPFGSGYAKSVYHSDIWVATGLDEENLGAIWWSETGEEWEQVDYAFEGEGKIVRELGVWLAGGSMEGKHGELILKSLDGKKWELVNFPEAPDDSFINSFLRVDKILLAGGNKIWYSSDQGDSWQQSEGGPDEWTSCFCYLKGKFYAAGKTGIYTSLDGKKWKQEQIVSCVINNIKVISGEIYAVGRISGSPGYLIGTPSDDKIAWAKGEDPEFSYSSDFKNIVKRKNYPFILDSLYSRDSYSNSWNQSDDNPLEEINKIY